MENDINEAEKTIIGAAIQDKNAYYRVIEKMTADDFIEPVHKIIFTDLAEMIEKGGIGGAAMIEYLASKKDLEKVGGQEYILHLESYSPSSEELDYYVSIIKDKALAAKFFNAVHAIENEYTNKGTDDISEFIGSAEKKILDITSTRRVSEFRSPEEIMLSLKAQFKEDKNLRQELNITQPYLNGFPTGYDDVDRLTGGFHPSDLIILAARPSVGKTTLALNFAQRMAKMGKPVGIFSLEMSAEQIILKLLSEEANLPTNTLKGMDFENLSPDYGDVDDSKFRLSSAINQLNKERLFVDDTSAQKLNDIVAKSRKLKTRYPDLALIVIDYLGLITNPTKGNAGNRQQEVSEITRGLKTMARDLKVPVMVLCQLSRGVESRDGHIPVLSDLRDSGSIEQDADMVFFIFRPDYYPEKNQKKAAGSYQVSPREEPKPKSYPQSNISETQLILRKNRNGQLGTVHFSFFKDTGRFEAIANPNDYDDEPIS